MPINNHTALIDGDKLYEGQVTSISQSLVFSAVNADTVILPFGRGVVDGAGDRSLLLPVNTTSFWRGVVMATEVFEKREGYSVDIDGNFGYPIAYMVSYVIKGVIGVFVSQNVTDTSTVFCVHTPTPATIERKGHFRADDGGARAIAVPNARFMRAGNAGTVVPLLLL